MTVQGKNGWLRWRDAEPYSGEEGAARVESITAIWHEEGESKVTIYHHGGQYGIGVPATLEEVMTIIQTETGTPPMSQVIVEQAEKIRDLEEQLEELRG